MKESILGIALEILDKGELAGGAFGYLLEIGDDGIKRFFRQGAGNKLKCGEGGGAQRAEAPAIDAAAPGARIVDTGFGSAAFRADQPRDLTDL